MSKFKVGDCVRATAMAEYLSLKTVSDEALLIDDIGWVIDVTKTSSMWPYTVRCVGVADVRERNREGDLMARARDLHVGTTVKVIRSQDVWRVHEVQVSVGDIGTIIEGPVLCRGHLKGSWRSCYFEVKFWTGQQFHFFPYELEIVT